MRGRACRLDEVLGVRDGIGVGAVEGVDIVHAAVARAGAGLVAATDAVLAHVRAALGLEVTGLLVNQVLDRKSVV